MGFPGHIQLSAVSKQMSREEILAELVLWTPKHGRRKVGRPAATYIDCLRIDTGLEVDYLGQCENFPRGVPLAQVRCYLAPCRRVKGCITVPSGKGSRILAYAPTNLAPDEEKDEFFSQLSLLTNDISRHDIVWILGDLNATTGADRTGFESVLGPHGSGTCNNNVQRLLEFCSNFRLRTERSFFQHKRIHGMTWFSNDGRTTKELDHILTSRRWHSSTDCRVYRSAVLGNSDHRLLAMTVCFRLQRNSSSKAQRKFDVSKLRSPEVVTHFQLELHNRFAALPSDPDATSPEKLWSDIRQNITAAATRVLGHKRKRKKKDFLSEETLSIVEAMRKARLEGNLLECRRLNSVRNKLLRKDKQNWLDNLAEEAEAAARRGDQGSVYRTLRTLSGKTSSSTAAVKAMDGTIPDTPEQQLERWREHIQTLHNRPAPPPSPFLDALAATAIENDSVPTGPPTLEEVVKAIGKLKPGRAAGDDGITPELLLHGGCSLAGQLQQLFTIIWRSDTVPADWLLGVILPFWKKGPKDVCSNYRGITLLSVPGKVFANILLARLRPLLLRKQRQEQSGFTPGRSTVDRILTLRLLAEKRREFRKPLYAAYVDLKQAFDSVDRNALWLLLKALGVPAKLVHLLSLLYSNTSSRVKVNGLLSDSFVIKSGVRQGCVLAPTIFNVAIDHVMGRTVEQCNCGASFGDFTVTDLDFADDVAILAEVLEVLQLALQAMDTETQPLGLMVSWEKTKVQCLSDFEDPRPGPVINARQVESVERFSYLGGTITSDCRSYADIHLRIGRASAAMASLKSVWSNRKLSLQTKLRLYNSLVLSILMYNSETWTLTATHELRVNAFDTRCLRRLLGIRWFDRVSNATLRDITKQPPLTSKIRLARLRLFGHIARAVPLLEPAALLREPAPLHGPVPEAAHDEPGDFNVHHQDWLGSRTTDAAGRLLLELSNSFGLKQIVTEPTRESQILDLVLTDLPSSTKTFARHGTSDHNPVLLKIDVPIYRDKPYRRKVWQYDKADYWGLRGSLSSAEWRDAFQGDDPEQACSRITTIISDAMEIFIPNNWSPIRLVIKHGLTTVAGQLQRRNDDHKFTKARKEYNRAEKQAKRRYNKKLKDKLTDGSITSKKWWNTVNTLSGRKARANIPVLKAEGHTCTTAKEKAEILAQTFARKCQLENAEESAPDVPVTTPHTLKNITFKPKEIRKILRELQPDKANGPDAIPIELRRAGLPANDLTTIYFGYIRPLLEYAAPAWNAALNNKQITKLERVQTRACRIILGRRYTSYRDALQHLNLQSLATRRRDLCYNFAIKARHSPRFCSWLPQTRGQQHGRHLRNSSHYHQASGTKRYVTSAKPSLAKLLRDSKSDPSMYRPISLPSNISKVMEAVQWSSALDKGWEVRVIALDIKGAFDKVWHNGLCSKLKSKGVSGMLLTWISSYLLNRSIKVVLSGQSSTTTLINASVPQGSILGPLLFSVYIDDLEDECENPLYLYADDSNLFCVIKTGDDSRAATESLGRDLQNMSNWAVKWKVTFEPAKCKAMTISRKRNPTRSDLFFGNTRLAEKDELEILGVTVDKKHTWAKHISNIGARAGQKLGAMRRVAQKLDTKGRATVYRAQSSGGCCLANLQNAHVHKTTRPKKDASPTLHNQTHNPQQSLHW
ncbi:hypothetical protein Bbelb_021610 [Branchiostoma belcheri]|nr:hypothetical protein Bbelb_021610 [Branchiostoma belcheri]